MKPGQRGHVGGSGGISLACLLALTAGGLGCAPGPTAEHVVVPTLAPLPLEVVSLLPAAAIPAPPTPQDGAFAERPDLPGGRSFSIGSAARGYLAGGRALAEAPGLRPRPISITRRATHGTDELVAALGRAAASVADRWPGSTLWAGDLSAHGGGDLRGHVSHNSGRDADLAFYVRDAAGRIADSPDMARVGHDGRTRDGRLSFDVRRCWALVEAMLRDPHVQVQWIFVASHLRALLLAEAALSKADPVLRERAAQVLRQPRDSSAHAEHFHVRIYCSLDERVEGCLDGGRVHPWVDDHADALAERVAQVLPFLRGEAVDEARYAITRIVRLRVRAAATHIEPLREHSDPELAALARDAVAFLRGERTPPAWSHLTEEEIGE